MFLFLRFSSRVSFKEKPMALELYIKLENGETISFNVRPSDAIASVKKKIEDIRGIQNDHQLLIYQNQELKDHEKLSFYKISNVVKLLGKYKKIPYLTFSKF